MNRTNLDSVPVTHGMLVVDEGTVCYLEGVDGRWGIGEVEDETGARHVFVIDLPRWDADREMRNRSQEAL